MSSPRNATKTLSATNAPSVTRPLWQLIPAVSIPMFMVVLDNLVVTTALPAIQKDLGASLQDLQWFVNAYTLVFAGLLLTCAGLGDRFGRRRMFLAGIAIFTVASALSAMATSTEQLIAARALQGVGAAAVVPLSLTLLTAAVPAARQPLAMGIWSAISGAAVAVGPLVGGGVIDGLNWQWIFWINVPVGVVAIPIAILTLGETRLRHVGLDLPGLVLSTAGVFAIVWGIVNAEEEGWSSTEVISALALGSLLLALFVAWEQRARTPLLPLRFYRSAAFSLGNLVAVAMYFGIFGSIFLLAQFLQVAQGYTALQAGVRMLPWTLMPLAVSPLAGALTPRVGGGRLMALGLGLQGAGLAWLTLVLTPDTLYSKLVAPLVVAGIGMGMVFAPIAAVVLGAVRPSEHGKASGANNAVREIGGALGIAVLGAVFAEYGSYRTPHEYALGLVPAVRVGVAVVLAGAVLGLLIPHRRRRSEPGTGPSIR